MNLSIIIVNWNTRKLLVDCVKSIVSSKPNLRYEIIVVDNGSSDNSVDVVNRLKIKNLHIVENGENLGYSKANNIGIKRAKGEYILLLNSDTKVKNNAIDSLYEFAESHPDAGVVGSKLLNADGTLQTSCFRFPTITNAVREYWFGQKGLFGKYTPQGNEPVAVDVVVGASFLITPKALKKIGGLDEKYFFFWEDLDYCREVRRHGMKVYYLPTSEVIHYHGSSVRKIVRKDDAWRKLIPGSKIYHGLVKHYIINGVIWLRQKWEKVFK